MDALLLHRATDMTLASRDLNGSLVIVFHRDFAEQLLPELCGRLEQARALAMAGRTVEAGRKYQALLVSSQVLAFAVAMQSMAQYADRRLEAGGQISLTLEKFVAEAAPILELAEVLRKLITVGALDVGVVAALSRPLMMSTGTDGRGAARSPVSVLQTGGNTIGDGTAKELNAATGRNLSRREWGRALEALKQEHGLSPGHHGKITSAGDYLDEAGKVIDSLLGYVP